jgi:hypothetical protein
MSGDDFDVIDPEPGVRLGVHGELERLAVERSRETGRPAIVVAFTTSDTARVIDVEAAHSDREVLAVRQRRVELDRAGIRRRVERVLRLVPSLRRMPD